MLWRVLMVLHLALTTSGQAVAAPAGPPFLTEDVDRCYAVYEAAGHHAAAEQLEREYLAHETPAVHEFAKLRNLSGQTLSAAIEKQPRIYDDARQCLTEWLAYG